MSNLQRLTEVVGEQIRCAEAMLETLAAENRALTDGDHDALGAATDAKAKLVDEIERLEAERRALAGRDAAPETPEWQRLRELVARCKEQNQKNGALLRARAEHVRVALKTLRGAEPELYGATGRAPAHGETRRLGTA
jgi:flagella synthesis protein FlgN